MSECVVRMEMPKDCQYCPMAHWDLRNILSGCDAVHGKRYLQGKDDEFWKDGRPSWCPIICSLPEGHGRLVDADALPKYTGYALSAVEVANAVENAPTIAASPWHRVEEEPKEYGNYLAVVNGEVMEVTYSDMRDDWKWSTCDAEGFTWIRSETVTHWMPLPEPPQEDA